jgi:tetratricopeptide (TPR) repeat protein
MRAVNLYTRKCFLLFCLLTFLLGNIHAQNDELIDSLENVVRNEANDSLRIRALVNLSIMFQTTDTNRAVEYANQALQISRKANFKWGEGVAYYLYAQIFYRNSEFRKALDYYKRSDSLYTGTNHRMYGFVLYYYGECLSQLGFYDESLEKYRKALAVAQQNDLVSLEAYTYSSIGNILWFQGYFKRASVEYEKALKIFKETGQKTGIANTLNNIAILHFELENYDRALEYYLESYEIFKELENSPGIAMVLLNTGEIYWKKNEFKKAMDYYTRALDLSEEENMPQNIAYCLTNIGILYLEKKQYGQAESYFDRAMVYWEDLEDPTGLTYCLNYIGILQQETQRYKEATRTLDRCRKIAEEIGAQDEMRRAYETLSKTYEATNNYKLALQYHKMYKDLNDTIFNGEVDRKLAEMEATHEIEKKEQQIQIQKAQLTAQDARIKKDRVLRNALIIGLIAVIIFVILGTYSYIKIRRAKHQISEQKRRIEKQKESIDDSIRYAKRIQTAVLPSSNYAGSVLGDHFILFKPKEIVSGDFYWATRVNEWIIFTVSDCTGHGVPGAFMSMLGVSFLNEIVRKKEITKAADVLTELRKYVIEALRQSDKADSQKDGMDMSLAAINTVENRCYWSGANNPLWIIRKERVNEQYPDMSNMIEEVKGDKMPVAIHIRMKEFTNHEIHLQKGDRLYLFSDGFQDQFGGPNGKKYKSKPFKRLLAETAQLSIEEQGKLLEKELDQWMHVNGQFYKQIDDITVLGLEI